MIGAIEAMGLVARDDLQDEADQVLVEQHGAEQAGFGVEVLGRHSPDARGIDLLNRARPLALVARQRRRCHE